MTNWSITTFVPEGGAATAAIRREDGSFIVPDFLRGYPGLRELLDDWTVLESLLRVIDVTSWDAVAGEELLSIRHPNKLLCVGANYRDHIAEMGVDDIPADVDPFFFSVPPTTSLVGAGAPVVLGAGAAHRPDWEAELAVVIGRAGVDIPVDAALDHVAGYACFNDITARGLMRRPDPIAVPFTWDWAASKGRDSYSPLGAMTPAWQIPVPEALGIRCIVNGTLKQNGNTSNLIVGIAQIVSAASRSWTLEPGDVIATGTPAGVGHSRGEQLRDGDVVRVEIDGLAPLQNPVTVHAAAPVGTH